MFEYDRVQYSERPLQVVAACVDIDKGVEDGDTARDVDALDTDEDGDTRGSSVPGLLTANTG
ncbi:uncharacterized protein N7515_002397 [Penicillium bovifimosum]|uniref:Uncharacterized protein n=1 Tax=Penicillium bovifimosum TaxID=126998 RepID=A0A9W9L828_9EURO|nr:uncharacterized protein N7515_002397 [Penicillium bovifimosum]KAJ5143610.1 hypothetical protein N7515_002397 [Penicillium bovifimosum]